MKHINKASEPNELTEYRAGVSNLTEDSARNIFDHSPKEKIRTSLLNEQEKICCYCMQNIDEKPTKIEHFTPISVNHNLALDYSNLLLSCKGNEKDRQKNQHCDTFKGDKILCWNPSDTQRNLESSIKYSSNGKISSNNPDLNRDIDEVLNLNSEKLKMMRKSRWETFFCTFKNNHKVGQWNNDLIDREITRLNQNKNEYYKMIIFLLEKKKKRRN